MRILHIDTGREMRGGQYQALFLVRELARQGHECALLAPAGAPLAAEAAAGGVRVMTSGFRALASAAREFDVVHAHTGRGHTLAAVCGVRPLVVARRVAFPIHGGPASRCKYRRAARFIAVSEYVKRKLMEVDVPAGRISVVYDGVPLLPERSAEEWIVAPASADPRKGEALARAAARLANVPLRVSGDLTADFSRASFLVYLTDMEGLGSGALLAMSAGVPVIASSVGGLPEVIEDGRTGLLVRNDPREVARAIERLNTDAPLRREMGRRARERVRARFSIAHMVEGTLEAYQEALA